MKLNRQQIKSLSEEAVAKLVTRGMIRLAVPVGEAVSAVSQAIADDLSLEDRVNDEVREILKGYESEIERGQMDYNKMFDMVKKKIVRERGLVL